MQEQLKHWRYGGNITHIGMEVLPSGNDITVTIDRIAHVENEFVNGKKQPAWVCWFKKNPYFTLPMVLNTTNRKRLVKLSGTSYLETVKDLPVILTKEMDKIPGESEKDWCLRISKIKPTNTKQKLEPSSANFGVIKKWMKEQGGTVEGLRAKYEVSEETVKKLLE